jgi:hypothetical protein
MKPALNTGAGSMAKSERSIDHQCVVADLKAEEPQRQNRGGLPVTNFLCFFRKDPT